MQRPALVWVDLRVNPPFKNNSASLLQTYRLVNVRETSAITAVVTKATPVGVCFEYDEPRPELLEPLQLLRVERPRMPVIMLTVKHWEELAVWALRMHVWDYIVLPMAGFELAARVGTLLSSRMEKESLSEGVGINTALPQIPGRYKKETLEGQKKLLPAISYVEENYSEKVALGVVARLCGLGRFQFSRHFKRVHGTTFREFLIAHRIKRARLMLKLPGASITYVAFAVGFNDLSHFAQMFRRHVGVCPSEYLHEVRIAQRLVRTVP